MRGTRERLSPQLMSVQLMRQYVLIRMGIVYAKFWVKNDICGTSVHKWNEITGEFISNPFQSMDLQKYTPEVL